jgi:SpoVK/Ycf46/Vps4 family AAA+-type ATPase
MAFLITDNEVRFMNTDSIKLEPKLPIGIYHALPSKMGIYLEKAEMKLTHGKIYGDSQDIASHVVSAYLKNSNEKNLGVLFSGGRGLGKTLTTKLIINELKDKYPVISISQYTEDLPQFLENISNCIILMDEFEKFMSGNVEDAKDSQSKQETLLSIFDGNTGCKGNLFLLTVNSVNKLDENLLSRPGRIRYHYKYESETSKVIKAYCEDFLNNKKLIPELINVLGMSKFVSMDIITSAVQELNDFPEMSPRDLVKYFNIEQSTEILYNIYIEVEGIKGEFVYELKSSSRYISYDWVPLSNSSVRYLNELQQLDKDIDIEDIVPRSIEVTINEDSIPKYLLEPTDIDINAIELISTNNNTDESVKITKCTVSDGDKLFNKKFLDY